jgi:hypothetical protein
MRLDRTQEMARWIGAR